MTYPVHASSDSTSAALQTRLDQLAENRPKMIDLGLDRIKSVLAKLDNPQDHCPPTFHIAGTNGKGSTQAFLKSILQAAGHKIHADTSPHLVRFNERFLLANVEATDTQLIDAIDKTQAVSDEDVLTYFEAVTAAGFILFRDMPADFLLLEVGLGGRLDCTNVIDAPLCSIITPIAMDHTDFLGDTIAKIANEKAGIIKPNRPVICARQAEDAEEVIRQIALRHNAPLYIEGQDFQTYVEHGRLVYTDEFGLLDLPLPNMVGDHQIQNAGMAIAALRCSGTDIPDADIADGVEHAFWPARMQRLKSGKMIVQLQAKFGNSVELWLDGGHNPHGGKALAKTLHNLKAKDATNGIQNRPLIFISGMMANKDATGYYQNFAALNPYIYTIEASKGSAASASDLCDAATNANCQAEAKPSLTNAIETILQTDAVPHIAPRILICGSLYLAGEILADHD